MVKPRGKLGEQHERAVAGKFAGMSSVGSTVMRAGSSLVVLAGGLLECCSLQICNK